ncbi:hypothetical protein PBRA_001890 [Plasmodiophora brassicae]|uniref:pyridoxal 5'-phosphate synthase n=1 Tax=Plasmodiophora brassicae TaxID=37360 RepID=A0A0G4J1S5_PLABS|nr:hypothetical protein PBRA_001890 [Plasmodiophora brassicae]
MFRRWLDEYDGGSGLMKNAMHLSTVRADGQPRSRMVLLKGVDADGRFLFGTDGGSDKGREIAANPKVALLFYWGSRQLGAARLHDRVVHERSSSSLSGTWTTIRLQP